MDMLPVDRASAERWQLGTDELTVLATSEQTGGHIFAAEVRMPPGGGPPVMHRHAPAEIYHVLEGELVFYLGDPDAEVRRVLARAGDVIPMTGGTPHNIRNESDADAVAFVVHSPGPVMEGFARAAARLAERGEVTMDEVLTVASEHGVELLGPVPERVV